MKNRRIRVRPSKASSVLGMIVGGLFVLVGLFFVIPVFGGPGIVWTAVAALISGVSAYGAFSEKGAATQIIEIEEEAAAPSPGQSPGGDVEARLEQLRDLYERRVISAEEYEGQRAEIIRNI